MGQKAMQLLSLSQTKWFSIILGEENLKDVPTNNKIDKFSRRGRVLLTDELTTTFKLNCEHAPRAHGSSENMKERIATDEIKRKSIRVKMMRESQEDQGHERKQTLMSQLMSDITIDVSLILNELKTAQRTYEKLYFSVWILYYEIPYRQTINLRKDENILKRWDGRKGFWKSI